MSLPRGEASALVAFVLAVFLMLVGVLAVMPVEEASADPVDYGPDGYFSTLGEGAEGMPMRTTTSEADAHKVLFGKSGLLINAAKTIGASSTDNAQVDGKYLVLGKGLNTSKSRNPRSEITELWSRSKTTPLAANEVLLWADDMATTSFEYDSNGSPWTNTFDNAHGYESNLAKVSKALDSDTYYSPFERDQFGAAAKLNSVCSDANDVSPFDKGCAFSLSSDQLESHDLYRIFPLAPGDMAEYFNASDGYFSGDDKKRQCSGAECNNGSANSWSRTAYATSNSSNPSAMILLSKLGSTGWIGVQGYIHAGLRPALRLNLDDLLLSAHAGNQGQVLAAANSLRLTFVDADARVVLSKTPVIEQDAGVGGEWVLRDLEGSSNLDAQSGLGWKLVDPEDGSGGVVASGRTNYDAAAGSEGNMVVPCETLTPGKDYTLSVWGQQDGSDTEGWSNRATVPVTGTVRADGDGVCALDIRNPVAYGISLTGQTSGVLTAYRIGEYGDAVFSQTGALKSVRLGTPTVPSGLKTVLKNAAESAGGGDVDTDNPIGWVASRWLGYPTDPASDDVTSAFSPYAGQLQLFAQELAKHTGSLGAVAGSLEAGTFSTLKTETLSVNSGPGLYLIVDSTQGEGGSLPIIVGTKVFNEALEDVVEDGMVDFVDAGVKGKPRLGRAVLKTSVTDVAKRIVNDAGLDGFDVGSEVEYEITLRVPDLSGFSSVAYDSYAFDVADVADAGLTLPAASEVRVFVDVDPVSGVVAPDTDVTAVAGVSIGVSGDTLTVGGLKAVFAESSGSGVRNQDAVPAGSLMRLRYRAVLNANASFSAPGGGGLAPNANMVTLTRSKSDGDTEQKTSSAHAYSFKVDVVKVDKDDTSKALGGARFEVSRDGQALKFTQVSAGVYRLDAAGAAEVTTHAGGTLTLLGVQARELSFRETQAPDGYFTVSDFTVEVVPVWNPDASEVTVASYRTSGSALAYVSQDGRSVTVADPSKSLANLPYTGGIGILLLLIVGGVFLVFAVRPYYLSHRAEATANILI
ncbi:MAG: hypothetical protein LKI21_07245 [Bifidobacterium crudilactis]|nr:hypothetical protein [Bifidobacterium crudilactis]